MDASSIEPAEIAPASRKLGRERAAELVEDAARVIVSKGKRVRRFDPATDPPEEIVAAMLGPTGNLRAPTVVAGQTVLVGFSDDVYREVLG